MTPDVVAMFRSSRCLSDHEYDAMKTVHKVLRKVVAEASLPVAATMASLPEFRSKEVLELRDRRKKFRGLIFSSSSHKHVAESFGKNEFCALADYEKRLYGSSRAHLCNLLEVVRNRFAKSYTDRKWQLPRGEDRQAIFEAVTSREEPHILFAALQTLEEVTDAPAIHESNPFSTTAFVEIVPWLCYAKSFRLPC